MAVHKRGKFWEYDFRLLGERHRKSRWRTRAHAAAAEKLKMEELLSGTSKITFADAYDRYVAATRLAVTTREDYDRFMDRDIRSHIGHLFIEQVTTDDIDKIKAALAPTLGPKSINQRLIVVSAVLRFEWKRQKLAHVPWIPMETVPKKHVEWYSVDERDRFLKGVYDLQPQWYLFFYLTMRLGLRCGEIYPIEHSKFMRERGRVLIDQAAVRGTTTRPLVLKLRKGNDTLVLEVTSDVFDAYDWHCRMGFAGQQYVFCPSDKIPKYLDSHKAPIRIVQDALALRPLSHHRLGRHSVGSQANQHGSDPKAIQAQLGHQSPQSTQKYLHVSNDAQRKLVESLRPARAPHEVEQVPSDELN